MVLPKDVSFLEAVELVEDFFGGRVSMKSVSPSVQEFFFVLYDAFVFKAGLDERHGSFGVILLLPNMESVRTFQGKSTTLRTGEAEIRDALEAIDEYCRLRLPDKYLDAFEASVLRSGAVQKYTDRDK